VVTVLVLAAAGRAACSSFGDLDVDGAVVMVAVLVVELGPLPANALRNFVVGTYVCVCLCV